MYEKYDTSTVLCHNQHGKQSEKKKTKTLNKL